MMASELTAGADDVLGKGLDVGGRLDDRAEVVMIGEFQPLGLDVVGDGGQAGAEGEPVVRLQPRRAGQGHGAVAVHRVRGFGEHEHRRAHGLQQGQMRLQGVDLGLGVLGQQRAGVPAADQIDAVARQQRLQLGRIARKFAAQFDAVEADVADVRQDRLQRRVSAQFGHVVIRPGDRADTPANGHDRSFFIRTRSS